MILPLTENWEVISLPLTGGSWSKSATVMTKRPANAFSGILIHNSSNLESISAHKSLDTMESPSVIINFTSDDLFLKFFGLKTRMNEGYTYTYCW